VPEVAAVFPDPFSGDWFSVTSSNDTGYSPDYG